MMVAAVAVVVAGFGGASHALAAGGLLLAPTATNDGEEHLFWGSGAGLVNDYLTQTSGGWVWNGPGEITGCTAVPSASTDGDVIAVDQIYPRPGRNAPNQLCDSVYARYNPSSNSNSWLVTGPSIVGAADERTANVINSSTDSSSRHVFYLGSDHQLWNFWGSSSNGPNLSGPDPVGGSLASDPVAIATSDTGIDVFYVGTDGGIYHSWYDGSAWHVQQPLPSAPVEGSLSAVIHNGQEHVFWRTPGGQLFNDYFTGAGWGGPGYIASGASSDPYAIVTGGGGMDVFTTVNGAPVHTWYGSRWSPLLGMPGSGITGPVSAVETAAGGEDMFFWGPSNHPFHEYVDPSGIWRGPFQLPG